LDDHHLEGFFHGHQLWVFILALGILSVVSKIQNHFPWTNFGSKIGLAGPLLAKIACPFSAKADPQGH